MLENERKHREWCLERSLEFNFKIGNLKYARKINDKTYETPEEMKEALQEVFDLSDIFLEYVMNGTNPCENKDSE